VYTVRIGSDWHESNCNLRVMVLRKYNPYLDQKSRGPVPIRSSSHRSIPVLFTDYMSYANK